jgi:hypothetical protein
MAYQVGDVVDITWRGEVHTAVISDLYYVAGKCPVTGRGRGYQDRVALRWVDKRPEGYNCDWQYNLYIKPTDSIRLASLMLAPKTPLIWHKEANS